MKTTDLVKAVWLLPLVLGLQAGPATAQASLTPAATVTLDVCQNDATGNWIYTGVAAVANGPLDPASMRIGYTVQNKQNSAGFADVFTAPRMDDQATLSTTTSAVSRYSIEAAPLVLGTLRGLARVQIGDPLNPASLLRLEPSYEFTAAICGCPPPTGCTRTQGYWKSKPGVVWPSPYSRTALFFSSGLTWQGILETSAAGGNGYIILAHQYIAAVLNKASGASVPSGVQTVLNNAATYFSSGTTPASCGGSACATQKTWAGILDTYNNGQYPRGPGPCPD